MPINSKQVELDNVIKRYKRRPAILEKTCYADFASWYDLCKQPQKTVSTNTLEEAELPKTEYEFDKEDGLEGITEIRLMTELFILLVELK